MKIGMVKTFRKQTLRYKCDQENQLMITNCLESYMVKELNCNPPWFEGFDHIQNCTSEEEWRKFNEVVGSINKRNTGCARSNCEKYSWILKELYSTKFSPGTLLQYNLDNLVILHEIFLKMSLNHV